MCSLYVLKSTARRVQRAIQSTGLSLLVLSSIVGASEEVRAQEEASVLLCDQTFTVKLKRLKKNFSQLSDEFATLWNAERASDKRDECKRYYQVKDSKRLEKLVEIGKSSETAYVIAPAIGQKGRDVEVSFWLVDVGAQKMVTAFATKLSSKPKQFVKDMPGALEEAVSTLLGALNTELASKAPAPEEEAAPETQAAEEGAAQKGAAEAAAAPAPEPVAAAPAAQTTPATAAATEGKPAAEPKTAAAAAPATESAAAPAAVAPADEAPVPAQPVAAKDNGMLRGVLIGVSTSMIGAGVGGVVGGALVSVAGGQVRGWEKTAAIAADDRSELNNVLNGVAVLADAATIGLVGVGILGAGALAATLLFVEE